MLAVLIIIAILLAIIVAMLWLGGVAAFAYIRTVVQELGAYERKVLEKIDNIQTEVNKKGSVTDPFKVANRHTSPGASTRHIITPKSPDQIRNENYEEIKKGASYGHDS